MSDKRKLGYRYYGFVEFHSDERIVIKPDFSKPLPWAVSYGSCSLPISCYVDQDIETYIGQHVAVNAYKVEEQLNPIYEVLDASKYEKIETKDSRKK